MHELYELKEKLMNELEEYGSQEMSAGSLEVIDKLSHAIKNICKIIEAYEEEEEYSMEGGGGGGSYEGGGRGGNQGGGGGNRYSREGGMRRRMSYARGGGQGRSRNARRDSMGRYSREGGGYSRGSEDMVMELRELMEDAPDERTKQEFQRLIQKLEQM